MKKALMITLVCLMFILPSLPGINTESLVIIAGYFSPSIQAIICALLLILGFIVTATSKTLKLDWVAIITALFCVLLLLQLPFLTGYVYASLITVAMLILGTGLSIIIRNIDCDTTKLLNWIALTVIINCAWQLVVCFLQIKHIQLNIRLPFYSYDLARSYLADYNLLSGDLPRLSGTIHQPNLLANLLTCGIFAIVHLLRPGKKKIVYFVGLLGVALFSILIGLCYSRISLVFAAFIILYALALYWRQQRHQAVILFTCGVILFAAIFSVGKGAFNWVYSNADSSLMVQAAEGNNGNQRLLDVFAKGNASGSDKSIHLMKSDDQRVVLWKIGLQNFIAHPFFGGGWGRFGEMSIKTLASVSSKDILYQYDLSDNAHNLFIELLATAGIVGTVLILFILGYALYGVFQLPAGEAILPLGLIMVNLIQSQIEYPLWSVSYLFTFIIMLSLGKNKPVLYIKTLWFKLIGALVVIFGVWQVGVGMNYFLVLGQFIMPNIPQDSRNALGSMEYKFAIRNNLFWQFYADIDMTQKVMVSVRRADNYKLFDMIYASTAAATEFAPYPQAVLKLAILEQMLGNNKEAERLVGQTLKIYPDFQNRTIGILEGYCNKNPMLEESMLNYANKYNAQLSN